MLGRLATWLMICGFDTLYLKDTQDTDLYFTAKAQDRILLTRDGKYKNLKTIPVCFIKYNSLDEQLKQIFSELKIDKDTLNFFSLCTVCNKPLADIEKQKIIGRLPPYVAKTQNSFSICQICGRIYWCGTHYDRMKGKLREILKGG